MSRYIAIIFLSLMGILLMSQCSAAAVSLEKTILAGGDSKFLEYTIGRTYGVIKVTAGYTGGNSPEPTAATYAAGGHVEAVEVIFDPQRISFDTLLDIYFRHTDPTDAKGQFSERGRQFRPVIYWTTPAQRDTALAAKTELDTSGPFTQPVVTEILQAGSFFPSSTRRKLLLDESAFRQASENSGRLPFLANIWGNRTQQGSAVLPEDQLYQKPDPARLRQLLSAEQFEVTQQNGTEYPFRNAYWDNHEDGIYVDIVSGEPLFSSRDKFESGTGWPSFTMPLVPDHIISITDSSYGMTRTEVRSRYADSHLGHVFADGPAPTGLRYCINSAALRFIPVQELKQEGYTVYLKLFDKE